MSAGAFVRSKYGASYQGGNNIHPIKIQPETAQAAIGAVTNTAPTGELTSPISAVVSQGTRSLGLTARMVALRSPSTGQPEGYKADSITRIPCLTSAFFDAAEQAVGSTTGCSYLGATFTVIGVTAEKVR